MRDKLSSMKALKTHLDYAVLATSLFTICVLPVPAYAILPPDVLFSIGSQVGQMYAITAAVIVATLAGVVPAIVAFFHNKYVRRAAISLAAVTLLAVWSFAILALFGSSNTPDVYVDEQHNVVVGTTTGALAYPTGKRYSSERFVFQGRRADGTAVVLDLYANRKEQEGGGFIHYYFADAIDGKAIKHSYKDRLSPDDSLIPDLLFSDISRSVAPDHSSRETYTFTVPFGPDSFRLTTEELKGDFILKNEPEYTMYASAGKAILSINGERIEGNVMFQRAYSSDYSKTVFFDGMETLVSEATQIIVWDDEGAFYLVDTSAVHADSKWYASHFWGLTKRADGTARRAFSGTVTRDSVQAPNVFNATIPDMGVSSLRVRLTARFHTKEFAGLVEGDLTDERGTRAVAGVASYSEYGDRN